MCTATGFTTATYGFRTRHTLKYFTLRSVRERARCCPGGMPVGLRASGDSQEPQVMQEPPTSLSPRSKCTAYRIPSGTKILSSISLKLAFSCMKR